MEGESSVVKLDFEIRLTTCCALLLCTCFVVIGPVAVAWNRPDRLLHYGAMTMSIIDLQLLIQKL